jgi:cell division protein ZapD
VIIYEYPFNERTRTYLRLEELFQRLGELVVRESALDHHFALVTLFEIMEVAARADLKSDVLKDLEKHKTTLSAYRDNPAIAQAALEGVLKKIDDCFTALNQQSGKAGHELNDNEWLMSVRSRVGIPGGTCEFDLPAYYAWQQGPLAQRRRDLAEWTSTIGALAEAIFVLLKLQRDTGTPQKVMAAGGQFQQNLPQGRSFQLLRLAMDPSTGWVPEISGNRLMVSIRMMQADEQGKLHQISDDAGFELSLCA